MLTRHSPLATRDSLHRQPEQRAGRGQFGAGPQDAHEQGDDQGAGLVVQLDGKEVYLDPGSKFCPYGILDWRYSAVGGLKLGSKGAEFGETPIPTFKQSVVTRMADLSLDTSGTAHGKVVLEAKGISAMLKRQEADVAYALYSALAEEVQRDKTLKLEPVLIPGTDWGTFVDQYDPKSPWADKRVRLAANQFNEYSRLGKCRISTHCGVQNVLSPSRDVRKKTLDPTTPLSGGYKEQIPIHDAHQSSVFSLPLAGSG